MDSMTQYQEQVLRYFQDNKIACIGPSTTWHTEECDDFDDDGRDNQPFESAIFENACIQLAHIAGSEESGIYISFVQLGDNGQIEIVAETEDGVVEYPYVFIDIRNESPFDEPEIKQLKSSIVESLEAGDYEKVTDIYKHLRNYFG